MKKVFIISSVALAVLLLFWGIYNFAFKNDVITKTVTEKTTKPVPSGSAEEEQADNYRIKDISNEGVVAPVLREDGNKILFYAALDGKVFSIEFDGAGKSTVSSQSLAGLTNVTWSSDRKKVISKFGSEAKKFVYNYETKTGKALGVGSYNFVWSNLGDKLLYQYKNGKANELSVADWDGSNWKKITDISFPRITIAPIPQTSLVSFWNYPASGEESVFSVVGLFGGEAKNILTGKFGADYLWSLDGKRALVSFVESQNGAKMELAVMNQDGTNLRALKIPTLVSKCVWAEDGKTVFYALPGDIPTDAMMPDDYQIQKFNTKDTFWKVNVETGEKTRLIELEELSQIGVGFDATNLFLTSDEKNLFFVNRIDGHLYRLDLTKK